MRNPWKACRAAGAVLMSGLLIVWPGTVAGAQQSTVGSHATGRTGDLAYLGRTISLSLEAVPLKTVLSEISEKANVQFSYSEDVVPAAKGVSFNVQNVTVAEALDRALEATSVGWIAMDGGVIVLAPRSVMLQEFGTISGKVTDESGAAIPFANVLLEGTTIGAAGDIAGDYVITRIPPGTYSVRASAVGYSAQTVSVTVRAGEAITQNFSLTSDVFRFEEVVVTGTMSPRQKLESTVAVSTITPQELVQAQPRSTTEMLRYVPGFTRVESSGGEVNQNISVRGILGVEYVMFMEDELPVFPTMHTFFMNADNLFRADENIQSVEVVRGGSSALFGSNAPGAIINFINKTGGPEIGGTMKASVATEGLARYDFNINGPLGDAWRFNMGGFYRFDRGVRYPGFPGIRGGQFKASVTRLLDDGYVRASLKLIDDRNQFILPLPFQDPDNPSYVPGFSDYGAMNTAEANHVKVATPAGELEFPLDDGLKTTAYWLTADASFNLGNGWNIQNTAQIMSNDQGWNGIFTGQPVTANEYFAGLGFPGGSTYSLFYTNHRDASGNKLPFNMNSNGGLGLVSASTLVHVEKPMSAFQNQLRLRKTVGEHTFSAGLYFANYTQTNRWYFSDILMDVRDNPRLLDMVIMTPTDTINHTLNGFRRLVSLYRNGSGSTTIFSGVIGAELKLSERLRADVGFRYESNQFVQTAENQSNTDLDGDTLTTYDIEQWGNRTFRHFNRSMSDYAMSLGLNYALTDGISIFAQGSRAFKMPALDEFLDASAQQQVDLFEARQTVMLEGGVKYSSPLLGFTVNGFWGELSNIIGQGFEIDPGTGQGVWVLRASPDNRAYGVELEGSVRPTRSLHVRGAATLTKVQTVEATGSALTAGGTPPIIGNLSASYTASGLTIVADWHYVGTRDLYFSNYDAVAGKYTEYRKFMELGAYHYLNLSADYMFSGQPITLSLNILNVYQSKGLEEGNPRQPGVKTYYFVARPILPRRIGLSLSYQF